MHIRKVQLRGYGTHQNSTLELPDRGLVVITGRNGSGKSSFLEAVNYAQTGMTIRRSDLYSDPEGYIQVETDTLVIKRGKKSLSWRHAGEEAWRRYDTLAKNKSALLDALPTIPALWRRIHVLDQHTSGFASATDQERKLVIERFQGVFALEKALKDNKVDVRPLRDQVTDLQRTLLEHAKEVAVLEAEVRHAQVKSPPPEFPEFEERHFEFREFVRPRISAPIDPCITDQVMQGLQRDLEFEAGGYRLLQDASKSLDADLRAATGRKHALQVEHAAELAKACALVDAAEKARSNAAQRICSLCQQDIPASVEEATCLHAAEAEAERLSKDAKYRALILTEEKSCTHIQSRLDQNRRMMRATLTKLEDAKKRLSVAEDAQATYIAESRKVAVLRQEMQTDERVWNARQGELRSDFAENEQNRRRSYDRSIALMKQRYDTKESGRLATLKELQTSHADAVWVTEELSEKLEIAEKELEVIELTATVLGSARSQVVKGSLDQLEHFTGRWLDVFSEGRYSVKLEPQVEKASKLVDKIGISVKGAGNGDIASLSAGEYRRVDAAFLFGFADMAEASSGIEAGTLWLDEPFDKIDKEGLSLICSEVHKLAEQRCVVLITHSKDLIDRLQPVKRVEVSAGRLV